MEKQKKLDAMESLWTTLDDDMIIREALYEGKFLQQAIKFISDRKSITVEEGKNIFKDVLDDIIFFLVENEQNARASQILHNVQINDFHYLYAVYQEMNYSDDSAVKLALKKHLNNINENYEEEEPTLKCYYSCFKILKANVENHAKHLENINSNNSSIDESNWTFGKFMRQSIQWRKAISIDVFFKSKHDPRIMDMMLILDKYCFFDYIVQNDFNLMLRQWINEQYLCKAGQAISATMSEPQTFDEAKEFLFRSWNFEEHMINKISKHQKDVVKNEFAKLGLFETREAKNLRKKLKRLFTTHTFEENLHLIKNSEITKFVLDHKLIDLLPRKFIDLKYISKVLEGCGGEHTIYDELVLLKSLSDLFTHDTDLQAFIEKVNATTRYLKQKDCYFSRNRLELRLINTISKGNVENFRDIANLNEFTRNFHIKLNSTVEELPSIGYLLENVHSINIDLLRDQFESNDSSFIPNFDDRNLSNLYGEEERLNFVDYVKRHQGAYATYVFIIDVIRSDRALTSSVVLSGCEEVANLSINDCENEILLNNVVTFLETFSVDTKTLRCLLQLLRLKSKYGIDDEDFEDYLDSKIQLSTSTKDINYVESLEVFWKVKGCVNPERSYLNPFVENNDWFRLVLIAQYFSYPLDVFISVCQGRLTNKTLIDNLICAVSYDPSLDETEKPKLTKRLRSKIVPTEKKNVFANGKFLDSKHDLFAILLKCNEDNDRLHLTFEDFQEFFLNPVECDDLLYQAKKYDWPLLAVLAGTTKLYRVKYCWLTWLILSSNYSLDRKFESFEELFTVLFEHCLRIGYLRTLDESLEIFYPDNAMKTFTKILRDSADGNFKEMDSSLKFLIVQLSEMDFNTKILKGKQLIVPFLIRCLIINLQHNIKFTRQQQEYLTHVHRSEIVKFHNNFNFELMKNLCKILEQTNVELNFEIIYEREGNLMEEIDQVCDELISNNYFEAAIEIANITNKSKTEFVTKFWMHLRETDDRKQTSFDIAKYMRYVELYGIHMDVFIKFLNSVIDEMDQCVEKYKTMVFVHRHFTKTRNNSIDLLEYEIISLYVYLKVNGVTDIEPLTSHYYENVIKKEKSLIHDSLYELKTIAMIDDLKVSRQILKNADEIKELDELMFHLLDINDIVQVLRIQEMFGHAPEDLKILVYMLSVSEGITSIYDITKQERRAISNCGQLLNRINKFSLRAYRTSSSNSMSLESSMLLMDLNESPIMEEPTRYRENKETLQALQGLLYKLKHGMKYGQRIVLLYRVSLFLNTHTFNDLMKIKNSLEFLEIVTSSDCENKLIAISDVFEAMEMTRGEIAKFIAKEITLSIISTRFQQFSRDTELTNPANLSMAGSTTSSWSSSRQVLDDIWGYSLSKDLHLILELCKGMTTLLGTHLIKFYKVLSQSKEVPFKYEADEDIATFCDELNKSLSPRVLSLMKQNIIRTEMLITAHECFGQDTEGIGEVLYLSKMFVNQLASSNNFNFIVKLLCGLGRYREMFYCFDILIKNDAFEALLGQFNDKQRNGLKNALLSYLKEYHPNNVEYFKMCASHFLMYTESAKIWRSCAMKKINSLIEENQVKMLKSGRILANEEQVDVPYLKCTKNALSLLNEALADMVNGTEMMAADKKIEMTLKYSAFCELLAMQIHLLKVGAESESTICPCVVHQEPNSEKSQLVAQYFANYELSVPQMIILNKNVQHPIDYTKAFFCRTIIVGDEAYLQEFVGRLSLTDSMIEKIIKLSQTEKISRKQEKFLNDLCLMVRNIRLKYRLASLLGSKPLLQQLVNDEQCYHYLLDTKFGNVDIY